MFPNTLSQHISIWGVFPDRTAANQAVNLLECRGIRKSQIEMEQRLSDATPGFDWSRAIYVRVPEGIIGGFAGGGLLGALLAFGLARGVPGFLGLAFFTLSGMLVGAVMGSIIGLLSARLDPLFETSESPTDEIAIGVQCSSPESEKRSKIVFQQSGATSIATVARIQPLMQNAEAG